LRRTKRNFAPKVFKPEHRGTFFGLADLSSHRQPKDWNMVAQSKSNGFTIALDQTASRRQSPIRRLLRSMIHLFSYHFVLTRRSTWHTKVGRMHLSVRPTVFHPRYFISSERFANFIAELDLRGKRVIDVGTGTGILAIAAAHAGSESVIATDINPNAALSVRDNAVRNGAGPRVTAACMDLLSGFAPLPAFDVIISNPPKHAKEPRDVADRGWHAGPNHRDVAALFDEAYERLKPGGRLYVMFSSDSELDLIDTLIEHAGLSSRVVQRYSIFIESFILYECMRAGAR
jgi:release factor glutamine methyltransferase